MTARLPALGRDLFLPFRSVPVPVTQPPPLYDADYPGLQSRIQLVLRPFLFIPHYVILIALGYVVALTTMLSWFAILFTGRMPGGLFELGAMYMRWLARVSAYMGLLCDRYPPFGDGPYPAQFVLRYPERSSRWKTFLRAILAIPSAIVLWPLTYVAIAVVVIAWFAILVTRRYPAGLFLFVVGWLRWELRLLAYLYLLTDHYPPFRLSETPNPGEHLSLESESTPSEQTMTVDQRILDQIALSREEYELLIQRLGREPNDVELGIVGALWSEHCGYKNSRPLLSIFPTAGEHVLSRAGEENAGAVDVGDGLCAVFKVESHNHPSAIEPYQGAATGVGGIVRDVFAMGAQPIALLDSLRFGPLQGGDGDQQEAARNRHLVRGVVGGIGGYGNCLGVPTVGGETFFDASYSGNPLVNAMCLGIAPIGGLRSARADGPGNSLILVGADTGRDGIHGATFASVQLDERSDERRPAVQVGNPFLEKLLMEACQELARTDWIVGLQDLGAAGLTSASIECAARSATGIEIDVGRVPRRELDMTPYEVMLSESQERMLVVARRGYEDRVRELFERWDLQTAVIGTVTDDGMVRVLENGRAVALLPVQLCTDPPRYRRQGVPPADMLALQRFDFDLLPDVEALTQPGQADADPHGVSPSEAALLRLIASPNIASKRWIYRQYDHQVLSNTVQGPGGDAAVLRLKGTGRGIALTIDGNGRFCYLDPFVGGAIAVAEAARNLVCVGAEPLAATDCLNFGNPEKLDVYYQLEQAIRGMSAACEALETPVVSGNVSLYNETMGRPIYPTPVVGMVGLLEDIDQRCGSAFVHAGDLVFLLGPGSPAGPESLAGSEYARTFHGVVAGQPELDLDFERRLQRCCLAGVRSATVASAHDCAEGGLAVTLVECCLDNRLGLDGSSIAIDGRIDVALFGEAQSRILVSVPAAKRLDFERLVSDYQVLSQYIGTVGGDRLQLAGRIDLSLEQLAKIYDSAFEAALSD